LGTANFQWLASQGITLTDYHGVTHPSQPNYVAAVGGSTNGVWLDTTWRIDSDTKTIVDLLEARNISWSEYQEDLPYSGFQGNFVNQKTGANDYVRKHKYAPMPWTVFFPALLLLEVILTTTRCSPLIIYDSVSSDIHRLAKIKNFTMFERDLANNQLPQWMFITPNMSMLPSLACIPTPLCSIGGGFHTDTFSE